MRADCTFANLGGDGFGDACPDCTGAIVASDSAALTVVNSTFFDPAPFPGTSYLRAFEGGRVRISGCEFAPKPGLTEELFYTRGDATVYADDPSIRIRSDSGAPVAPLPLAAIPAPAPGANATFLERTDEWFAYRRKVRDLPSLRRPALELLWWTLRCMDPAVKLDGLAVCCDCTGASYGIDASRLPDSLSAVTLQLLWRK